MMLPENEKARPPREGTRLESSGTGRGTRRAEYTAGAGQKHSPARYRACATPDGPGTAWVGVVLDTHTGFYWLRDASGDIRRVTRDAVGNWLSVRHPGLIFACDGEAVMVDHSLSDGADMIVISEALLLVDSCGVLDSKDMARLYLAAERMTGVSDGR